MKNTELIDTIVRRAHNSVVHLNGSENTLYIIGNSPFTRAMKRRCDNWGLKSKITDLDDPDIDGNLYVIDKELYALEEYDFLDEQLDVDKYACSDGVAAVLIELGVFDSPKTVCIIGRGDAVEGIARVLSLSNCTIIQCNSHTDPSVMNVLASWSDIVINGSPAAHIYPSPRATVIDLSGSLGDRATYGPGDMGKITTAFIAEEFVRSSLYSGRSEE